MGMMEDKDIDKVLLLMLPYFAKVYTVTPSNPRATNADELASKINRLRGNAESFENIYDAYDYALEHTDSDDVLIVCGSLYLCSDIYNHIKKSDE